MNIVLYWLLFALAAVLLLVAVPLAGRWEQRRSDDRERARRARLARSEQAARRIRLHL